MKVKAQLSGEDHQVSLSLNDGFATVEIDGRPYEIEVRPLARGEYLLLHGSSVYKCRVVSKGTSGFFEVNLQGHPYNITISDPKRLRRGQTAAGHDHGAAQIISPMPGKVVHVLVKAGARVEAGAGIVVVEAMKMQNEMKSPKAGIVVSINAEAGATVNAGDVLAVIE
ncbi:MAG TPA: biotin/lipoyl-containing protein [Pyrinomonadaceae bacterium]|nr:biotin/lipoyl-containing protein [Pyrinomonadaceae bacterium]